MAAVQIPDRVLSALAAAECDGPRLVLQGAMERALYQQTAKVIEAAGGKWNKGAKAHLFEGDAAEAIEPLVLTGTYSRTKQDFGQFDTPFGLAEKMAILADLTAGMAVLEPSVGIGNIAHSLEGRGAQVAGIEIDTKRYLHAKERCAFALGINNTDFLRRRPEPVFDRVVMNPPFAKQADIDHVEHALRFLKPGGRLLAIMSAGIAFRSDRKSLGFWARLADRHGSFQKLPPGSFRESGTEVNALIVSMPGAPA